MKRVVFVVGMCLVCAAGAAAQSPSAADVERGATFITLLLVPVLYAIFVLDLKLVKWEAKAAHVPA